MQKKAPDETVIPDTFLTSFLEVSQNYTFSMESPKKAESGSNFVKTPTKSPRMSRIPVKSPYENRARSRLNAEPSLSGIKKFQGVKNTR